MEEEYNFWAEKKLSLKILLKLRKKNERTRQKDGKKTKKKGTRASVAPPLISMHTEIKVACSMHAHTCMHALIKERKKNAHVPVTRWWIVQTFMHASIKERKKKPHMLLSDS